MMNGEFKRYVREGTYSSETEDIAGQLRELFVNDPNILSINVMNNWSGTIIMTFKEPLINKSVHPSAIHFQISIYIHPKGHAIIGFSLYPSPLGGQKDAREIIPDGINIDKLYYALKKLIDDPEHFMIKNDPVSIKYIANPSIKTQKEVIAKDPKNFIYINNPDPELEKKYGHLKKLNRAGIV